MKLDEEMTTTARSGSGSRSSDSSMNNVGTNSCTMPMMMFSRCSSSSLSCESTDRPPTTFDRVDDNDDDYVSDSSYDKSVFMSSTFDDILSYFPSHDRRHVHQQSLRSLSVSPPVMSMMTVPLTGINAPIAGKGDDFDHTIPADILKVIGDRYLNPKERARLAMCNKRLNALLPPLMRIRITASTPVFNEEGRNNNNVKVDAVEGIANDLFVCPAPAPKSKSKESRHHGHRKNTKKKSLLDLSMEQAARNGVAVVENDDHDDDQNAWGGDDGGGGIDGDCCNHEDTLFLVDNEHLYYGRRYYLCSFDYERGHRVYLGRHTRHGINNTPVPAIGSDGNNDGREQQPTHCYSIGFHPDRRKATIGRRGGGSSHCTYNNQTWEFLGGTYGDVVIWSDGDVSLSVGGDNPRPGLPDSQQRSLLSCTGTENPSAAEARTSQAPSRFSTFSSTSIRRSANGSRRCGKPVWCAIPVRDEQDPLASRTQSEQLRILSCHMGSLSRRLSASTLSDDESMTSNFDDTEMSSEDSEIVACYTTRTPHAGHHAQNPTMMHETRLSIYSLPEACDEGEYLLYSPDSSAQGDVSCDGSHVVVNFDYWVREGVMHFRCPALPFTLGLPILETDSTDDMVDDCGQSDRRATKGSSLASVCSADIHPMTKLLELRSARWGSLIYYVAVAADVSEGKKLDMTRFLNRVTDHEEHTVRVNEKMDLVTIEVRDKKVINAPDVERKGGWKFLLSW